MKARESAENVSDKFPKKAYLGRGQLMPLVTRGGADASPAPNRRQVSDVLLLYYLSRSREVKTIMSSDPRAQYDAIAAELAATSPATTGQMFGMPVSRTMERRLPGSTRVQWSSSSVPLSTLRHSRSLALDCLTRQSVDAP